MHVLVTGATGYVGGRLVPRLLAGGHRVRVLVRDAERVAHRPWRDDVEVVEGDLLDPDTLPAAFEGIEVAYYLVHSMCAGADFSAMDRRAATHVVSHGRELRQLIYLGGILPDVSGKARSEHLGSRAEVGEILRAGCPTTELRAGPIIGSGSASFEMVRYLTERLPIMIAPKWVLNRVQPIAVRDILSYLLGALGRGDTEGVIDVGTEPLPFREMMYEYAAVRGLVRRILPVPVLAPRLAARWVGLVTPIPNSLAVPLVEGVVHPVVADTTRARTLFPSIEPISYHRAVVLALERTRERQVETRWSGASFGSHRSGSDVVVRDREGTIREVRTRVVDLPPEVLYATFTGLGGERGWLAWNWAWELRGLLDRIVGGPGLRRGRRHPDDLLPGEAMDFWRVEAAEPPDLLRLRAEMKVPGEAWLQWEAVAEGGSTRLVQTASFVPRGLLGALYWYALYPFHRVIFSGLANAVVRSARQRPGGTSPHDAIRADQD